MGNWRRVQIIGKMSEFDAEVVKRYLANENYAGCLHNGGLMGLPNWGNQNIDCVGNLYERDYSTSDLVTELDKIRAFAPSMDLAIHVGGDYEDDCCIATITTKGGIEVHGPQQKEIKPIPKDQIARDLNKFMHS